MKLGSIQMLRALAALMVIYTHSITQMCFFASNLHQHTALHGSLGAFGVDLFFVISGFVIYSSANRLNARTQTLSFLWHRFRRINFIYYVATLVTLIVWLPSFLRHGRPPVTGGQVLASVILLPFPGSAQLIMSHAWTLSFEWYFYILFSLLILSGTQKKAGTLGLVLGFLILLGWLLRNYPLGVPDFYTDPLIFEFGLGVAVGFASQRWAPGKKIAQALLWPGILLSLTVMLTGFYNFEAIPAPKTPTLRYVHAFCWGGSAALVLAGCVFLEKTGTTAFFRKHRLILLVGDASYSIYLFHYLVFGAIGAIYLRVGLPLPPDLAIPIQAIIAVAGCLLFYKWVEVPLLKWLGKERSPRLTPSPPAGS